MESVNTGLNVPPGEEVGGFAGKLVMQGAPLVSSKQTNHWVLKENTHKKKRVAINPEQLLLKVKGFFSLQLLYIAGN